MQARSSQILEIVKFPNLHLFLRRADNSLATKGHTIQGRKIK